jgi:hypothetical protein
MDCKTLRPNIVKCKGFLDTSNILSEENLRRIYISDNPNIVERHENDVLIIIKGSVVSREPRGIM